MPSRSPEPGARPTRFSARVAGAVVYLSGELDLSTVPQLRTALESAAKVRDGRIVLHMAELSFIDSSGVRALVECRSAGRHVEIRDASAPVLSVLRMSGLEDMVRPGRPSVGRSR